jgi:hypothetical protein
MGGPWIVLFLSMCALKRDWLCQLLINLGFNAIRWTMCQPRYLTKVHRRLARSFEDSHSFEHVAVLFFLMERNKVRDTQLSIVNLMRSLIGKVPHLLSIENQKSCCEHLICS